MKLVISTSALIGRKPIAVSRFCSQAGDGPFLTPRTRRSAKAGHSSGASILHRDRAGELALDRLDGGVLELAHVGRGKIAGDAVHAGAVRPVRRQIDLDHRIVEPGIFGVACADRRVVGQIDDAFVVVGDFQLEFRHQHAAALDAADGADRSVISLPGM